MVFYITVLRALAACLITNSHYTGIYPTDLIANGGLIGDVIFFAISGYCLYDIKGTFPRWYGKRLLRCYVPVLLITVFYMVLGAYSLSDHSAIWWYVYPTSYHFVASIVVLYIPYYVIMKTEVLKKNILPVMALIFMVYLAWYLLAYDKSYYHIDTVREPMIRFLFVESMLLGVWFKQNEERYKNRFSIGYVVTVFIAFGVYFASKILFSRDKIAPELQILNQIAIFVLLYTIFCLFASMDSKLEIMPGWLKRGISYLAKITLEIYVVQYVLIDVIRPLYRFPVNWIVLTTAILAAASILHLISHKIFRVSANKSILKG